MQILSLLHKKYRKYLSFLPRRLKRLVTFLLVYLNAVNDDQATRLMFIQTIDFILATAKTEEENTMNNLSVSLFYRENNSYHLSSYTTSLQHFKSRSSTNRRIYLGANVNKKFVAYPTRSPAVQNKQNNIAQQ